MKERDREREREIESIPQNIHIWFISNLKKITQIKVSSGALPSYIPCCCKNSIKQITAIINLVTNIVMTGTVIFKSKINSSNKYLKFWIASLEDIEGSEPRLSKDETESGSARKIRDGQRLKVIMPRGTFKMVVAETCEVWGSIVLNILW